MPTEHHTLAEVQSAFDELSDKREATLTAVRLAMQTGGAKPAAEEGAWSHDAIDVKPLLNAANECAAFPRQSAEAASLVASARIVVSLREALLKVVPGNATSWTPLATALGTIPTEELALAEVKAALLEFRAARNALVDGVLTALRGGCSRAPPRGAAEGASDWDHTSLDSESVVAAALQLEHFPTVDGSGGVKAGGAEGSARRNSIVARRQSLARSAEEAGSLVASAKKVARLRTLIHGGEWAELQTFLKGLEGTEPPLHEIAADEARRAARELQDMASALEARVQRCLDSGGSKPPPADKRGRWDHSSLQVAPLREAAGALAAFPLKGAAAGGLIARAQAIAMLREALQEDRWGDLDALVGNLGAEERQLPEVRAAVVEKDDTQHAVEQELAAAMATGRSLKVIGKKTNNFTNKDWYVAVEWDHSGLAAGTAQLSACLEALSTFPKRVARPGLDELLASASHALVLRQLIAVSDWAGLRKALEKEDGSPLGGAMDEAGAAWQELLCHELGVATGGRGVAPDQAALKVGLAAANMRGLLTHEAPVYKALNQFIDPPEYLIDLDYPEGDVFPDPTTGKVVLTVKVRGAKTLRWLKNSVELKEGADGGRIEGVTSATLTFHEMLARDADQKFFCEATNKWGKVNSKVVHLRLPDEQRQAAKQFDNDVQKSHAERDRLKQQHKEKLGGALKDMGALLDEKPLVNRKSIGEGLQAFSGQL